MREVKTLLDEPFLQQPKRRRRIQHLDKITVLSNVFLKNSLEDTSDILRPVTNIDGILRLNKRLRGEGIFNEPLLSGISTIVILNAIHQGLAHCHHGNLQPIPAAGYVLKSF